MQDHQPLAALDLGSNSFHLIVAEVVNGRLQVIDRLREMVRLAAGLDERNALTEPAMMRALETLKRFGQRLRALAGGNVRVVGTNTLRKALNRQVFMARAQQVLGHPVEVIAGREEARLIYLGVAHSLEDQGTRRLVVDIGGGSTEDILGRAFQAEHMDSLHIGCVELSRRFFKDGEVTERYMRNAEIAALQELESIAGVYRRLGWDAAIGSSGTVTTVQEVLTLQGWGQQHIPGAGLRRLRKHLIGAGHCERFALQGLNADRAPIFAGGVAVLIAVFEALGVEQMAAASGALREGLLYDLLGRIHHEDVRERTVQDLANRYRVDARQARRVADTALELLRTIPPPWGLSVAAHDDTLRWAAELHEIGLEVSHSQYQKHGAYLARNHDLPGFSQEEQALLALLIRAHRRKLPLAELEALPAAEKDKVIYLSVVLRLAVLLHRGRGDIALPDLEVEGEDHALKLRFPEGWLAEHPLTAADLEQEAGYWKAAGMRLRSK
ncbi:MAG: exopolyphosphatase [Gammaproteobacteria bacterium]